MNMYSKMEMKIYDKMGPQSKHLWQYGMNVYEHVISYDKRKKKGSSELKIKENKP